MIRAVDWATDKADEREKKGKIEQTLTCRLCSRYT